MFNSIKESLDELDAIYREHNYVTLISKTIDDDITPTIYGPVEDGVTYKYIFVYLITPNTSEVREYNYRVLYDHTRERYLDLGVRKGSGKSRLSAELTYVKDTGFKACTCHTIGALDEWSAEPYYMSNYFDPLLEGYEVDSIGIVSVLNPFPIGTEIRAYGIPY